MTFTPPWTRAALLTMAAVVLESVAQAADGPQSPQESVVREIFGHFDQSEVTGKEVVPGTATLRSGAQVPFHTHPGDEAGYVLRGSVTWKVRGQPDKQLHVGDSLFPEWPGETFPLYAIRPSRRLPPAAVEVFLDFCTEICEAIAPRR